MDIDHWNENKALEFFVYGSLSTLNKINSNKIENHVCSEAKLEKVLRIQYFNYDSSDELAPVHYKIDYNIESSAVIQVHGTFASAERYENSNSIDPLVSLLRYEYTTKEYRKTYVLAKIWGIISLDKAEQPAVESICKDENHEKFQFISGIGTSCNIICETRSLSCAEPILNEKELDQIYTFGIPAEGTTGKVITFDNGLILFSEGEHCSERYDNSTYICYCTIQ